MFIQNLRAKHDVVILEHEDTEWMVDLKKMIQNPVNQPLLKREVRYRVQESNRASSTHDTPPADGVGEGLNSSPTQVTR